MNEGYSDEMMYYGAQPTGGDELLLAFLAAFGIFMFIGLLMSLLMYIFFGIGMSRIAKNEGHSSPWLSWIPVVNIFMIPMAVEDDVHGWLQGKFTKVNVAAYLLSLVISFVSAFAVQFLPVELALIVYIPSLLLMLVPSLLLAYGFYFIADRYSAHTVPHMILAVVTGGWAVPFQLFRWRNRESLYN